ncbi:bestrophin family protein [Nocardioides sp. AX2bis]|uniref:bestrophin family protein n=1 Tax=Nocardioides sp. AX2bis TaxID=2653157 RepID=UPI001915A831|nr:bestrophin family ion channel [Nocardioides sp. AX2bis]
MIVSAVPAPLSAWRGLLPPLALLLVWDVAVTLAYLRGWLGFGDVDIQYTLYGTAVALFLGFMVNAAYARWWEARTLWGTITNHSRNLAREAVTLLDTSVVDARPGLVEEVVRAQAAYVHVLRTSLRGQDAPAELARYTTDEVAARVALATNKPNAVLNEIGGLLSEARRRGMVDSYTRVQAETTLATLADAQGGLERIKNTPLPVQYRFLPSFFARTFCVILPFAMVQDLGWLTPVGSGLVGMMFLLAVQVGRDLADPFRDKIHDVPMTAITRTIEIDLLETIGEEGPDRVGPRHEVLW